MSTAPADAPLILDPDGRLTRTVACVRCDTPLSGVGAADDCPGCGSPVVATVARHMDRIDAEGRICRDIPCGTCGYNLRSQAVMGVCSECGTSVRATALVAKISDYDFDWFSTVYSGSRLIVIGVILSILMSIAFSLIAVFFIGAGGTLNLTALTLIGTLIGFAISVVYWTGIYRFTAPNPALYGVEDARSHRPLARKALVATIVIAIINIPLATSANPALGGSLILTVIGGILSVVSSLVWLGMVWLVIRCAHQILAAVPAPGMARFATFMANFTIVNLVVVPLGTLITIAMTTGGAPAAAPGGGQVASGVVGGAFGCVSGIWGLALIVFIGRVHLTLGKPFKAARAQRAGAVAARPATSDHAHA